MLAPHGSRSSSANPAASPMEMPARSASQGRQGTGEISSSAWKPCSVMRHRLSAPPTTAASHTPVRISCAASMKHRALLAQAMDTTIAGPCSPRAVRT